MKDQINLRGNKPDVHAELCPPLEKIAFPIITPEKCDLQGIWPYPLPFIITTLEKHTTFLEVFNSLPDIEILQENSPPSL